MSRAGSAIAALRRGAPTQYVHRIRRETGWIVAGGMFLAVCMVAVREGTVGSIEASVFHAVNGLPDVLEAPLWLFQVVGMLAVVAVAAVAAAALRRPRLGLALGAAIPLKLMTEWWVVKALVERERPMFSVPEAIIREVNSAPLGFPSGHAVFAFVVAGLLAPYLGRRPAAALYVLAGMNGVARVYLGSHNPLDIVAGAALGVVIAAVLNAVVGVPERTQQPVPGSLTPTPTRSVFRAGH